METKAKFKKSYEFRDRNVTMSCDVLVKSDKTISITNKSGGLRNSHYYALINDVKKLVVEGMSDKHFYDISELLDESVDVDLVNKLMSQTEDFKNTYIENTKSWSIKSFEGISKMTEEGIINNRGVSTTFNGVTRMSHSKASYAYFKKISAIIYNGMDNYVSNKVKEAEMHYIQSIKKLAHKIKAKGLEISKVEVDSNYTKFAIDNSMEVVISDGTMTVRAWTILAMGEINAPHYRYLIK